VSARIRFPPSAEDEAEAGHSARVRRARGGIVSREGKRPERCVRFPACCCCSPSPALLLHHGPGRGEAPLGAALVSAGFPDAGAGAELSRC
jgi:hypothetical protein